LKFSKIVMIKPEPYVIIICLFLSLSIIMKKALAIVYLCLGLMGMICCGQKKPPSIPVRPDMTLFKGKCTYDILCRLDSGLSYALYLPSGYDTLRQWPVIIAFDSHGDGRLPVNLMKKQAEKYQYIIVGSNNSRNGLASEVTSAIYDGILKDLSWRFSLDPKRIYTMGFSGGARVAAYQGIYKKGIRAVIGCSGGLPSNASLTGVSFNYLGVVGTLDFNYLEMNQLFKQLDATQTPHYLMTFEGTHTWPPDSCIEDIFAYLQMDALKEGLLSNDTQSWKQSLESSLKMSSDKAIQSHQWLNALEINNLGVELFKGLPESAEFEAEIIQIKSKKETLGAMQQQESWLSKEQSLQQEYLSYLGTKSSGWWNSEVQRIEKIASRQGGTEESRVYRRLLSYMSLACFMNASQARNSGQWDAFGYFVSIYGIVDPENNETAYLQAVNEMHSRQSAKAIESLKRAFKMGFNDCTRLMNDTTFSSLRENSQFIDLCKNKNQ
jgi:dienelactone hydrolase